MTVTVATRPVAAQPRNPLSQSVHDSLVVARRNLIRMMRIPCRPGSVSPHTRDLHVSAGKEQVK
jgi:hypothetical protein